MIPHPVRPCKFTSTSCTVESSWGELARLAFETVREMMVAAVEDSDARPGMVGVIQTFGSSLKWNPHIHAIVVGGGTF